MAYPGEARKTDLIDKLAVGAQRSKAAFKGAAAGRFIRRFYDHVPPPDMLGKSQDELFGAAQSAWQALQTRRRGQPKIRIFNPDTETDGWTSPHTVIQIVNDDMPFLVDSVTNELNRHNLTVHLLIHPVVGVRRDAAGALLELGEPKAELGERIDESIIHVEIAEQCQPEELRKIEADIRAVLDDVRAAVDGWRAMRVRIAEVIAELDSAAPPSIASDELDEARAFLRWIDDNHFLFLGYREYAFATKRGRTTINLVPNSGLGLLRDDREIVFEGMTDGSVLPADIADFVRTPRLLMVSKATCRSTVHRAAHMDTIGIKRFDGTGKVVGERLFTGLFTSAAYNRPAREIPLLRRKIQGIVERAGLPPNSHDGKALLNILETMPRDEMLQTGDGALFDTVMGILHLQERQRVALFCHRDPFGRFVSCLVYVPRDRFNTGLRVKLQAILEAGIGGPVTAAYTQVSESVLARLHFIVKTAPGAKPPLTDAEIEARLVEAARDWADDLGRALSQTHGATQGLTLVRSYGAAFPSAYRERFDPTAAVRDIAKIEAVLKLGRPETELYRRAGDADHEVRFKMYHRQEPVPLSDVLPVLENMGFRVVDEVPYEVAVGGGRVWIHEFGMHTKSGQPVTLDSIKNKFEEAFASVWAGNTESDGFNHLVIGAALDFRQIVIIRAYAKYLRQAAIPFSQSYMEETLDEHAKIARLLVELFEARFDPALDGDRAGRAGQVHDQITGALEAVDNLDQDRILRRFLNVIDSTIRTNYFQPDKDGAAKPYVSLKLDSRAIDELPLPRPFREIWVYSPRVEAVHLRGGKVGRGGIRWSDRREDFRTEILGLMKAQMTKNAVIVPVGSKGGFVVKRPPASGDREAVQAEGVACYTTMMQGLLDITDNLAPSGAPIAPPYVVRHDDDDPYLVVAADKGTATFSDIANGIAQSYGFWLDDAFASGGSVGYDHKKMGITARGAWESVKRHLREAGIDCQTQDFTVIGIGDMAGDVFGNGLLQSPHILLLAAFNHMHIFVDPTPDPAASYAERKRLFNLPRSSWADYDAKLISQGGGVFERRAKSIKVTPEMRQRFELPARETVAPNDLIKAILKAKVDLAWFGGIGTYVKARHESHADVGDRANDAVRVNGDELRATVVGEGANLGVTQLGRIDYALAGGRLNTDFIDNSAGVGCSDREVNIKILLGDVMAHKKLTRAERDKLLAAMTDEVGELVLIDNYRQTMALSHAEAQAREMLEANARLIRNFERAGRLDRGVEFLPDEEAIAERRAARLGLTRPEMSILLAYAKIVLYQDLLETDVPDDAYLVRDIGLYFPKPLRKRYAEFIGRHRLHREISATYITNSIINRAGPTFVNEMQDITGRPAADIVRAYLVTRQVFDLPALWADIEALDNRVPARVQTRMNLDIVRLIERITLWFLRQDRRPLGITAAIETFQPGIARLTKQLGDILSLDLKESVATEAAALIGDGVPEPLAHRVASLGVLTPGCDVVRIASASGAPVEAVGQIYFGLGSRFGLDWLRLAAERIAPENEWQKQALSAVVNEFYDHQSRLTVRVLDAAGGPALADGIVEAWAAANSHAVARSQELLSAFRATGVVDLAMLTVANHEIAAMIGG